MTLTMASPPHSRRSVAQPRWATPRRPDRPTWGGRWAKIAAMLGTPFMPWQRLAADVAGEYDPETGVPYYREVNIVVMRQQGKTTIETAVEVDRCVSWPDPQKVVYSAQSRNKAREKLLDDQVPQIRRSPLGQLIEHPHGQVVHANGNEAIRWPSGSIIELLASVEASGHGSTYHLGMIDEAWKGSDERREQAIRPAMLTIPDAQLWVVSTAGNDASTYLRRKVETGRAAAVEDRGSGICYIEYSVPDDMDPFDLDVMLGYMPALCPTPGPCTCSSEWRHTVTQEVLLAEQQGMDPQEYRRAYGNQWVSGSGEQVIPDDLWQMCCDPTVAPDGEITYGIDVLPDRDGGSIAAGGNGVVEVVESRPGPTGWMVEAAKKMHSQWGGRFRIDGTGQARSIADDLEADGIPVERLDSMESAAACARLFDAIADGTVKVRTSAELDAAVKGLAKRPIGDRFVWSRTTSINDVTPVWAVTLAWDGSSNSYDLLDSVW